MKKDYLNILIGENINDRSLVIKKLFRYHPMGDFIYFDDRKDNLEQVQQQFPNSHYVHVSNPLLLYKNIRNAMSRMWN